LTKIIYWRARIYACRCNCAQYILHQNNT
jgi:hypothetical protein